MLPSGSADPALFAEQSSSVHAVLNDAVGAWLVGRAEKSLNRSTIGLTVELLDRYGLTPTDPGAWRAANESVAVNCQAAGSVAVAAQTFARMVVGAVPVTCSRIFAAAPLAIATAGTMICGLSTTAVEVPASEVSSRPSCPSALTITLAPYSRFTPDRRPMNVRYTPLPVGSRSAENVVCRSVSLLLTAGS